MKGEYMTALLIALFFAVSGDPTGTVIVNIVGFGSNDGHAVVALFTEEEMGFPPDPSSASITRTAGIEDLAVILEIENVPFGNYLAFAYHDINGNGRLDPADEPMGFSAQFGQTPGTEPPSFSELCFSHGTAATAARITVRKMERPSGPPQGGPGGGGPPGGGPR
jgi:uncharacterized protein (DUF2141 family)